MNVLAVRKMIQLCKNFRKLEVFVHVSTAYANCEHHFIEEQIYPPPVQPHKLIDALELVSCCISCVICCVRSIIVKSPKFF